MERRSSGGKELLWGIPLSLLQWDNNEVGIAIKRIFFTQDK